MTSHRIGTREEWLTASAGLLEREKELRDQPAARENLPLVSP
jgi:predicted dithiol-disulfide oxidoreductase (DUF899 family)